MIIQAPQQTTIQSEKSSALAMSYGQNDRMAGSVPVWNKFTDFVENIADTKDKSGKDDGFGFTDIIDIVNPLHHLPVVSNFYESATGDTIGAIAQIVGGALFGGPIGAIASAGMVALQAATDPAKEHDLTNLQGTTIAVADMRHGMTPYNT